MPPSPQQPIDTDHLLPEGKKASVGPIVGAIIVVALLLLGAFYFWGAWLSQKQHSGQPQNNTTAH